MAKRTQDRSRGRARPTTSTQRPPSSQAVAKSGKPESEASSSLNSRPKNLGKVFNEFARELSALRHCFEVSSKALEDVQQQSSDKTTALLEKFKVEASKVMQDPALTSSSEPKRRNKDSNTQVMIRFPAEEAGRVLRVLEEHIRSMQATEVIRRSLLLASVSQFDAFIAKLLEWIFYEKPELLNASNRTVDYSEIVKLGSFEELRRSVIQKEIETLLRDSHPKQFDWLEGRFGLKLRTDLECWPIFIELTERRNLFAHGDGVISPQYLRVCADHNVPLSADAKVGAKLEITREYLLQSIEVLYELSMKLTQVLWRKLFPSALEDADTHLTSSTFDLIKDDQFAVARKVLETFLFKTNKPLSSDRVRRICILNFAQCLKWSGDQKGCESAISKEDWSACGPEFAMPVAVLRDDFDGAARFMARIGKDGVYRKYQYLEWPIFKRFKETPQFLKQYQAVFGEPFELAQKEEIDRLKKIARSASADIVPKPRSRVRKGQLH